MAGRWLSLWGGGAAGALSVLVPLALTAQQRTSELPRLPVTPRFAALGGAAAALVGSAASVFTNPAGLAPIRAFGVEGAAGKLTDSSRYFLGAAAVRLGAVTLGGGVRAVELDAPALVDRDVETTAAAAFRVKGIALGLAADYYTVQDSSGAVSRLLTTDVALTMTVFDIAALAFTAQNIGRARLGTEGLPLTTTYHLGFSLSLTDTYSTGRLQGVVEQRWREGGGGSGTRVGLEGGVVWHGVGLMARAGTGRRERGSEFDPEAWGASLVFPRGGLDYAYLDRRTRGPLHLFGFRFTL